MAAFIREATDSGDVLHVLEREMVAVRIEMDAGDEIARHHLPTSSRVSVKVSLAAGVYAAFASISAKMLPLASRRNISEPAVAEPVPVQPSVKASIDVTSMLPSQRAAESARTTGIGDEAETIEHDRQFLFKCLT